jgi:Fe-S-cluster containining protein
MSDKGIFIDCCMTGFCCGYRRDSHFGGVSYMPDEVVPPGIDVYFKNGERFIPVDKDDTCIYLEKLNNGFTRCSIHEKRPRTCRLYNCLTEKKVKYLNVIVRETEGKVNNGSTDTNTTE